MQVRRILATTVAITRACGVGAVIASESQSRTELSSRACSTAADDAFKPEANRRTIVAQRGYRLNRIRTDAACAEVLAVDRNGRNSETQFKGADLRMVGCHEVERSAVARS